MRRTLQAGFIEDFTINDVNMFIILTYIESVCDVFK